MKLIIPEQMQLPNALDLRIVQANSEALEIEIHSSECKMHPVVLCMISALNTRYSSSRLTSAGTALDPSDVPYFAKMDPLNRKKVGDLKDRGLVEGAGTFIPVRQILKNKEMGDFATDFVPLLHASAEQSQAVKYVLSELIRNVLEHSGCQDGAFAAAEVASDGTIRVGVADLGIGVLSSIRRSHAASDEKAAIALALRPGVSGATSNFGGNEQNGGAGLFFMKAMASLARENMVVFTGSTVMRMGPQEADGLQVHADISRDNVGWSRLETPFSGTAVGVDFTLADSLAFKKLLGDIRDVYHSNVRSGKLAAKKARFT